MRRAKSLLMIVFAILAPWVAAATLFFNARGQWIATLGCILASSSMAALALDSLLRWQHSRQVQLTRSAQTLQNSKSTQHSSSV